MAASLANRLFGQGSCLSNRFRPLDEPIDVAAINELAWSRGPIAVNRAFANWVSMNRCKQALPQQAITLSQVFHIGAKAENRVDTQLCLDALGDMARFQRIGTAILVGGDSDCMPLLQHLRGAGRTLIGIASRRTPNPHWAGSHPEFKYCQALVETPPAPLRPAHGPAFQESSHGFASFHELLASMGDLVESRQGEHDHELRIRPLALIALATQQAVTEARARTRPGADEPGGH